MHDVLSLAQQALAAYYRAHLADPPHICLSPAQWIALNAQCQPPLQCDSVTLVDFLTPPPHVKAIISPATSHPIPLMWCGDASHDLVLS